MNKFWGNEDIDPAVNNSGSSEGGGNDQLPTPQPAPAAVELEAELTVYARMTNSSGLAKANKVVRQEQYVVKTENSKCKGQVRVRSEQDIGADAAEPRYDLTIKRKIVAANPNLAVNNETTLQTTAETFEAFKAIAPQGMVKTRYIFLSDDFAFFYEGQEHKVNNLHVEVDVFQKADGMPCEYVKIDIELQGLIAQLMQKTGEGFDIKKLKFAAGLQTLPIALTDVFTAENGDARQQQILDGLYQTVFITRL